MEPCDQMLFAAEFGACPICGFPLEINWDTRDQDYKWTCLNCLWYMASSEGFVPVSLRQPLLKHC